MITALKAGVRFLLFGKSHCFLGLLHGDLGYYKTNHLSTEAKDCHLKRLPLKQISLKRHRIMFLSDCGISQLELIAASGRIYSLGVWLICYALSLVIPNPLSHQRSLNLQKTKKDDQNV